MLQLGRALEVARKVHPALPLDPSLFLNFLSRRRPPLDGDGVPLHVADLYLEYVPHGSALRFSLAATNLFDKAGVNSRYTDPFGSGQTSQQYIAPRQVIGTVAYSW